MSKKAWIWAVAIVLIFGVIISLANSSKKDDSIAKDPGNQIEEKVEKVTQQKNEEESNSNDKEESDTTNEDFNDASSNNGQSTSGSVDSSSSSNNNQGTESQGYLNKINDGESYTGDVDLVNADTFGPTGGQNKAEITGNVYIKKDGIKLLNTIVNGTIFVDPGENGTVYLIGVVAQKIKVLSGAQDSIYLEEVDADELEIDSPKPIRVVTSEGTHIISTTVTANSTRVIIKNNDGILGTIELRNDGEVELDGSFSDPIVVRGQANLRAVEGSQVQKLVIAPEKEDSEIRLSGQFNMVEVNKPAKVTISSGSVVTSIVTNAEARITVEENAKVEELDSKDKDVKVDGEGTVKVKTSVESVKVTNAPTEALKIGEELKVEAKVTMNSAGVTPVDYTVESSNNSIVSVTGKTIKAVTPGTVKITVKAGGKTDSFDITVVKLVDEPFTGISGTIIDAYTGKGVVGAYIEITDRINTYFIKTDANGDYSLEVPAGSDYYLMAEVSGHEVGFEQGITITKGQKIIYDFSLDIGPTGTISGVVTDPQGEGLEYAGVKIKVGDKYFRVSTDEIGRYTLDYIPVGKGYTAVATLYDYYYETPQENISLNEGEITEVNFIMDVPQGKLTGKVVDSETGQGIKGASVWLNVSNDGDYYHYEAETNEHGIYTIKYVTSSEDCSIVANSEGYFQSEYQTVTIIDGQTTEQNIALEKMDMGTITGQVTDGNGSGIMGTWVEVDYEEFYRSTKTDANGNYTIDVPVGTDYVVAFYKDGYERYNQNNVTVTKDQTIVIDAILSKIPMGSISGTVTDSESQEAVSKVKVYIKNDERWFETETDEEGKYTIDVPANEIYDVLAYNDYYKEFETVGVVVLENHDTEVDFELEALGLGRIIGKVIDADSGEAIEGAEIEIWVNADKGKITSTNQNGEYAVNVPVGENCEVTASAPGYHDITVENVTITHAQTTVVNFALKAAITGTISGRVTDLESGEGIPGAAVEVYSNSYHSWAVTDEEGWYLFENVLVDEIYTAYVKANSYSGYEIESVQVEENQNTEVNFELQPLEAISGIVTDANSGEGIFNASIWIQVNERLYSTYTNENGEYVLFVPAGVDYVVNALVDGYEFMTKYNITVTNGETATVNFELLPSETAATRTGTISGIVTASETGEGVFGAELQITSYDFDIRVVTDEEGKYIIEDVPVGENYNVEVYTVDYNFSKLENVTVEEGQITEVNFELLPSGTATTESI